MCQIHHSTHGAARPEYFNIMTEAISDVFVAICPVQTIIIPAVPLVDVAVESDCFHHKAIDKAVGISACTAQTMQRVSV